MSSTTPGALSASTSSFVTSLIVNTAVAGGELVAFIVIRRWIKAIYEPRTYIPPKNNQAPVLSRHPFWSIWQIITVDPEEILYKNGVDPYFFVRFLIMMTKAMIPIWLISWIVLLPVDSVNSNVNNKSGLDVFTYGNVARNKQSRLWVHLVLDYVFIFFVLWLIWREMKHWLVIRQRHLTNPSHSRLAQANTVLVTGIPRHYLDEGRLAQLFSHLPGGVKRIWLNRDLKEMPDLYERRMHATKELESAQVSLIKFARKYKLSRELQVKKLDRKDKPIPDTLTGAVNPQLIGDSVNGPNLEYRKNKLSIAENGESYTSPDELGLADRLVPRSKRPTHRIKPSWSPFSLGFLGIGKKMDTIEWARREIAYCTEELEKSRAQLRRDIDTPGVTQENYPPLNSAFIHFNQQIAAHMAQQCLTHNQPYIMSARYIEQSPDNVIWRNLSMNQYERNIRQALSWGATFGLILLWATPVAFIGVLSNVKTLTDKYHWLAWINGKSFGKKVLQGVISGVLPPVLLALLLQLVPFILRQLASLEGIPSKTGVELNLMTRFFLFLVINTFFVITLAAGLISAVQQFANDPSSVANTLATQMPTASTFFITLILTQFTGTMGTLLRLINLILYYVQIILLGGTPRSVFTSRYNLNTPDWGETFPRITVYAVIMLAYCVISPIINGFGAAFFLFATLVYKYLFIWVIDQPPSSDTGGLFFPKAITHVFVARNEQEKASAIPQGVLMIVLVACTAACQYIIVVSYEPLKTSLPLSLAHLCYGMPEAKNHEGNVIEEDYQEGPGAPLQFNSSNEPLTGRTLDQNVGKNEFRQESSPLWINDTSAGKPVPTEEGRKSSEEQMLGQRASVTDRTVTERDYVSALSGNDVELGANSTPSAPPPQLSTLFVSLNTLSSAGQPTFESPAIHPLPTRPQSNTEDTEEGENTEKYFAIPGGPGIISRKMDDNNDPNAFFHPATKEKQRIIWLPQDELGLCQAEMEVNEREGVKTSSRGAWLNSKGKVQISEPPPDET
ncbi:uncharacterized protein L203_104244 [Cryptococcus depauperatus CBS 7841]|uniref:DUF221-domain-containing protein n=1 Tax=Cryptococcus depauperatus CBS 7841 TaxID=1295531 RepID=A0AAJ8JV46_9TREE